MDGQDGSFIGKIFTTQKRGEKRRKREEGSVIAKILGIMLGNVIFTFGLAAFRFQTTFW